MCWHHVSLIATEGSIAIKVNVIGDTVGPGCSLVIFDGAFAAGVRLSVLAPDGPFAGKVLRVSVDGRALVEVEGRRWWARRMIRRPMPNWPYTPDETWQIVVGLA
jgi:hypothetical protein